MTEETTEKIYLGIQYFRQPKQDSNIRYSFVLDQLGEPKYQRFIRLLVNDNLRLLSSLVSVLDPSDLDKVREIFFYSNFFFRIWDGNHCF